jgi:uncharacterized protein YheU (UPF0270 family)
VIPSLQRDAAARISAVFTEARQPRTLGMKADDIIEVPFADLAPDTLRRLIEEFVTRDTTDYGARECTIESKVADVMRQLKNREVTIVFEPTTSTVNIVPTARR